MGEQQAPVAGLRPQGAVVMVGAPMQAEAVVEARRRAAAGSPVQKSAAEAEGPSWVLEAPMDQEPAKLPPALVGCPSPL